MACCPICCHRMRMNFNERPWCMVSSIEEPAATRLPFPFVMIYKENNRGRLFFTFTLWCVGFWRALHCGWNFQILSENTWLFHFHSKYRNVASLKFGFSEKATKFEKNLCLTFDKIVLFCASNSVLVKKLTKIFQNKCGQVVSYKL